MGRKTPLKERLLREYVKISKNALREPRNWRKISTTTKRGPKVLKTMLPSTTDHRLTQNVSKTTRFRESNPVVKFKGEPPF